MSELMITFLCKESFNLLCMLNINKDFIRRIWHFRFETFQLQLIQQWKKVLTFKKKV